MEENAMHTLAADRRAIDFLRNFYNITGYDMFGHIASGILENGRKRTSSTQPFWLGKPNPSEDSRDRTVGGLYLTDNRNHSHWINITLFGDNPRLCYLVSFLAICSFGSGVKIESVTKKYKTESECVDALQKDESRLKNCPFHNGIYRPVIEYQVDEIPFLVLTIAMRNPLPILNSMKNMIDTQSFFSEYRNHRKRQPVASLSFFNAGYFGESIKLFVCDSEEFKN